MPQPVKYSDNIHHMLGLNYEKRHNILCLIVDNLDISWYYVVTIKMRQGVEAQDHLEH